jgi:hypothetical protein
VRGQGEQGVPGGLRNERLVDGPGPPGSPPRPAPQAAAVRRPCLLPAALCICVSPDEQRSGVRGTGASGATCGMDGSSLKTSLPQTSKTSLPQTFKTSFPQTAILVTVVKRILHAP